MATILPVPESEKVVLDNLLKDLSETYPDKVIVRLQQDHKKWYEKVTRLYKNIGYSSRDEFLSAYGFTVKQGKGGRPSVDLNAIVDELVSRYEGDRFVTSLDQLKEENPDLAPKFKNLQNKAKDLFGMTFNNYLKERGIFQNDNVSEANRKAAYKEKLDVIVLELKRRYEGKNLPNSLTALKEENRDIEELVNINSWIEKAYAKKALEFFVEQGLVKEKEKKPERTETEIEASNFRKLPADQKLLLVTEELAKRVEKDGERVHSIELLKEKYPDLPIQTIDSWCKKVLGEKAKTYLISKGIMKSIREVCLDNIKHYNTVNMRKHFLLEKQDPSLLSALTDNNAIVINRIPPLGKDYYFVIDTGDKSPFGGDFWEQPFNRELQNQLIDPSFKVKYISQANLLELLDKKNEHKDVFRTDSREAKSDWAMKVFETCVKKVEQHMDKTNDYNSPALSSNSIIQGSVVEAAVNPSYASDFFNTVAEWMKVNDKGYDYNIEPDNLRNWYDQAYALMLHKGTLWGDGEAGVRYPVGLAVAYIVYIDPKAKIELEFVRDKWELRGDYRSSKRVCLEIADYGYDISVHYNYYDAYDM